MGDFIRATTLTDKQDADAALYQAISELPQPNRDTLAFLMLHLQRVSSSPECKMPISNLAKVFGPTLVSYTSDKPLTEMLNETKYQVAVRKTFDIYFILLKKYKHSNIIYSLGSRKPASTSIRLLGYLCESYKLK